MKSMHASRESLKELIFFFIFFTTIYPNCFNPSWVVRWFCLIMVLRGNEGSWNYSAWLVIPKQCQCLTQDVSWELQKSKRAIRLGSSLLDLTRNKKIPWISPEIWPKIKFSIPGKNPISKVKFPGKFPCQVTSPNNFWTRSFSTKLPF